MHPQNTFERAFITIIMLGGVTTFSYIMSIFINQLHVFKTFNKDFNEGDELIKFFAVLSKMNNREIKAQIKKDISEYFEYKWTKDRNLAISKEEDLELLAQLPHEVQENIYTKFLFGDFLIKFKKFFWIRNLESMHSHTYFNWNDTSYRELMIHLLRNLMPIQLVHRQSLMQELDEVSIIYFIERGEVDFGYEINK